MAALQLKLPAVAPLALRGFYGHYEGFWSCGMFFLRGDVTMRGSIPEKGFFLGSLEGEQNHRCVLTTRIGARMRLGFEISP